MRTTVTLDPDVAVLAERMQRVRGQSFEAIVNEALRSGLRAMAAPAEQSVAYSTPAVDLGRCTAGSLDDVAEVLALAERVTTAPHPASPPALRRP